MKALNLLLDFVHLVYPRSCILCDNALISQENLFCFKCIHHLKRNSIEKFDSMSVKRKIEHIAKIKWCFSLYEFEKNTSIQEMIHLLKYRNKRKIGKWLGDEIANELKKKVSKNEIDGIIVMPLNKKN